MLTHTHEDEDSTHALQCQTAVVRALVDTWYQALRSTPR
jgi:hypothetical protein